MKKRTLIVIVLLVALAIGASVWLAVRWNAGDRGRIVVTTTGPVDIRLWGVRPSAGDTIYDPNGKEIRQTFGFSGGGHPYWAEKLQRFDFIFELGDTNEPPLFYRLSRVEVSGEGARLGSGFSSRIFDYKGKRLLRLNTTFDRTFKKSIFFGLRTVEIGIDAVDITLRYYHGPRRSAISTFKGPFKPGGKFTDETGSHEISFSPSPQTGSGGYPSFEFNTKQWLSSDISALLYDAAGKRRVAKSSGAYPGPGGMNIKYGTLEPSLKGIAMITVGEKPFEATFKNVRLDVHPSRLRSHAAYLDKMAAELDLKLTPKELTRYRLKNVDETFRVVNIVRGKHIRLACYDIFQGYGSKYQNRLDAATLNGEQAERLRQTALGWTEAMDPGIRAYAMRAGLHCKWPEFVEPAFELIADPPDYGDYSMRNAQTTAAGALQSYRDHLSERDIDRIRGILLHQEHRAGFASLKRCLEHPKSENRIRALWELAYDDRPWLWWDAIEKLAEWKEFEGKHDSLPEKVKLRLFIIGGVYGFSNAEQIAPKAYDLLDGLLTPQLRALGSGTFSRIFNNITRNPDHRFATGALINYLGRIEHPDRSDTFSIEHTVKCINLWHDVDIGGLGTDRTSIREINKYDWSAIIGEAIAWYDAGYEAGDPNSVL